MTNIDLKNMIKKHEGFRPFIYKDTQGFLTGGYGHAFLENSPLSQQVSDMLFEEDFKRMGISKFLKFKKQNLSF